MKNKISTNINRMKGKGIYPDFPPVSYLDLSTFTFNMIQTKVV